MNGLLEKQEELKVKLREKDQENETELKLRFDLGIIELLGSQLYTKLPSIIVEFVSNSYDADATKVTVTINENDLGKEKITNILIEDNGIGLAESSDNCIRRINNNFLNIGRKRRKEENCSESKIYHRKLQGKKGIGKLAGFGITDQIKVTTASEGLINSFILDYNEMKNTIGEIYYPKVLQKNVLTNNLDGTSIELINIKRKTDISLKDLSESIVKRLQIFDKNFSLKLVHIFNNLPVSEIDLTNDNYLEYIKEKNNIQFSWSIPDDLKSLNLDSSVIKFFCDHNIKGEIFTTDTPLKKDDQGIILYANKKLCQDNYSFNDRANDNFYSYLIGHLDIDYIDEDLYTDNISTSRDSLVWENEISEILKYNIDIVVKKIQNVWREKRKVTKEESVNEKLKINISNWVKSLNDYEQKSAKKLVDIVINDDHIDECKTVEYISYIQDMYSFTSFKDFAENLVSDETLNISKVLDLIKKWGLIEAKELAKVAKGRITTIEKFDEIIHNNSSERDVIQPFLEKFPWILDPKINEFRREVTFEKILKETFPDSKLEEPNRRLDFLCLTTNDEIHILELKRPNIKIDEKYFNQIYRYQEFAMEKYPNKKIRTTLISDNWGYDRGVELMFKDAIQGGKVSVKSYSEMLLDAKNYNNDLIKKYEELLQKNEESN